MDENLRESFRIQADSDLEAELQHGRLTGRCSVVDLSAGGAKVKSTLQVIEGGRCTLRARLGSGLRGPSTITAFVSFPMEVLSANQRPDGSIEYRLRNTAQPGSPEYEEAVKLITLAQRAALAKRTGASQASPMVSDEERRRRLRTESKPRFGKGSTRPGSND
jgi:hypothetical protein